MAAIRAAYRDCSRSSSTRWPSTWAWHSSTAGISGGSEPSRQVTNAAAAPKARAATTRIANNRRVTRGPASVGVQGGVELDAAGLPRHRLDRAGDGVAAEQDVVGARELHGLHHGAVGQGDLGTGRDVAA